MRPQPILLVAVLLAPALAGCVDEIPGLGDRVAPPGALAADYLRPGYRTVEIVILAEAGAEPNRAALADAEPVLEDAIGKPVQITIRSDLRAKGEGGVYTTEELRALEREVRTWWTAGDLAVIHALYLAGKHTEENTIGLAYGGSSLAFFIGRIKEGTVADGSTVPVVEANPGGAPERRYMERAVLVHEVGHLLGLVNAGIPMVEPHEDPENPGHSSNPESVMYATVDHPDELYAHLESGNDIPYRFDEADLADLRAFASR